MNRWSFRSVGFYVVMLATSMPVLQLYAAEQPAQGGAPSQAEMTSRLKARLETQEKELQAAMRKAQNHAAALTAFEQSPAFMALVQKWERAVAATDAAEKGNAGRAELAKLEEAENAAAHEMYAAQDGAYRQAMIDVANARNLDRLLQRTRQSLEAATTGKRVKEPDPALGVPDSPAEQLGAALLGKAQARTERCTRREYMRRNFSVRKSVVGATRLMEVTFEDQSVPDAFSFVSDVAQVNVVLDWPALEAAGITKETKIANVATNSTVIETLDGLAKAAVNAKGERPVRLWLDGRFVLVSTDAGLKAWQNRHANVQKLLQTQPEIAARWLREAAFNGHTFEEALETLGKASKTKIVVDWETLSSAGVKKAALIEFRVYNVHLIDAVSLLLQAVQANDTVDVSIEGEQLKIGKRK